MNASPARLVPCLALALWLLAAGPIARAADDAPADETRFVLGQRVNLREQASTSAPVRAVMDINTPLHVIGRSGIWCQARSDAPMPLEGYVACSLLGTAPVRLDDVEAAIRRAEEVYEAALARGQQPPPSLAALYELYARAFWVDPSPQRWARMAGTVGAITKEGVPIVDPKTGRPVLPPNADLEAARVLMASGRVKATRAPATIRIAFYKADAVASALRRAPLPTVKPSFFAQDSDFDSVVPSGEGTRAETPVDPGGDHPGAPLPPQSWLDFHGSAFRIIEGLAHRSGAAVTMVVLGPWEATNNDAVVGLGGIGEARVTLSQPARIETLRADGAIGFLPVQVLNLRWLDACNSPESTVERPAGMRGQPDVGASLVAWIGRALLPGKARVATRRLAAVTDGPRQPALQVQIVDLDGDEVPDFYMIESLFSPEQNGADWPTWRVVWANIAGHWKTVDATEDPWCD
jgi:hypothetical protein